VTLSVENYSERSERPEITEIVSQEPSEIGGDASVVDLDGEWFIQWTPAVSAGEEAELRYSVADDADFEITVEGVDREKLTINA